MSDIGDPAAAPPAAAPTPVAGAQPPLPALYDRIGQARQEGYGWDEINGHLGAQRDAAKAAGYSDDEINTHLGLPSGTGVPVHPDDMRAPIEPQGSGGAAAAATMRGFADKYLTTNPLLPQREDVPIRTAGDLFKSIGLDIVDVGKILRGAPGMMVVGGANAFVHGVAALTEMMDGRPRTTEDWAKLNAEATGATSVIAGGLRFAGPKAPVGLDALRASIPATKDVIDAAASIKGDAPLTDVAANLGQHFVETGEHPLDAAARAQSDPALMKQLQEPLTPAYGASNKIITNDALEAARARLKAKSTTLSAGIDPQDFLDLATIGAYHIEAGARSFASFSAKMIADHGEAIKPHLERIFAASRDMVAGRAGRAPANRGILSDYDPITGKTVEPPEPPVTPETIRIPNPEISTGIIDAFKWVVNPAGRGESAGLAANIVREGMAREVLSNQLAARRLRVFGRAVADLTPEDQATFIHAYETGRTAPLAGTPLGDLADTLHDMLDQGWREMDKRGIAPGYIQDYLPHMYENPVEAERALATTYGPGGRGARPFLKERLFSTYLEAAQTLGLKPRTVNPIEMVLTHLAQVNKYIAKDDIIKELKANSLVEMKPHSLTRAEELGYAGTMPIHPSIERGTNGTWVAPEPVATILNRWLTPSLASNGPMRPMYDAVRSTGNMLNMAQLGLSGFHGGFVAAEAGANAVALGIKQISRLTPEEMARGVGSIVSAPAAPIQNYLMGRKVISQLLGKGNFGPEVETMADALLRGGGRTGLDPEYQGSAMGSFWDAIKSSATSAGGRFETEAGKQMGLGQAIVEMYRDADAIRMGKYKIMPGAVRATAMLLPRIMDTIMHPLMRHFVPVMKAGGFARLMQDELRVNPEMEPGQVRDTAARIWHSIDNRLGQVVYDNRFWDKTLRDMGHISVRSLGWTGGTIDEGSGGIADLAGGRSISAGDMRQLTERASYVIGMPVWTAMMGAMFGVIWGTWKASWSIYDYMNPPTGGKDAQGGDERASMPGYSKDAQEWAQAPLATAQSKIHPLWPLVHEMMTNRQWNGAAITDPRPPTPLGENALDYADFLLGQFEPISFMQGPGQQQSHLGPLARRLGLKPAPYIIREPEREKAYEMEDLAKAVAKKLRQDAQQ